MAGSEDRLKAPCSHARYSQLRASRSTSFCSLPTPICPQPWHIKASAFCVLDSFYNLISSSPPSSSSSRIRFHDTAWRLFAASYYSQPCSSTTRYRHRQTTGCATIRTVWSPETSRALHPTRRTAAGHTEYASRMASASTPAESHTHYHVEAAPTRTGVAAVLHSVPTVREPRGR